MENNLIKEALKRFKRAAESTHEFRQEFKSDIEFVSNDQWDKLARQDREQSGRPCMTFDMINPALRQIVNEERQNRPSIQVDPTGGGATVDVAHVFAGLIRSIEQDSNAESAYDTAGWYAAAGGVGYLRVRSEYENKNSFNQKLVIEAIADPMTVFIDPDDINPDGHDLNWAFIITTMDKDAFRVKYPDSEMLKEMDNIGGWDLYESDEPEWMDSTSIRVAEYFYKKFTPATLYQIFDNNTQETIETTDKPPQNLLDDGTIFIVNQRPTHTCEVRWVIMTSEEVLQDTKFEGYSIPIIPVYGEMYFVNGKKFITGAVRKAKDAQKAINFAGSLELEVLDLNSKAPWIGAAGQFDSFESNWADANRKNFGFLEYNAMDNSGNLIGAPTRNAVEAPIQASSVSKQNAENSLRNIFGVTDPVQDARQDQTSGVAILARKQQQSVSNYHYYDNLVRSVKQVGRILVDVIPFYYDNARMVRIIKPNGDQEMAAINQVSEQGKMIDLSVGEYDVVVQTGPSYASRRQELVNSGIELISAYPNAAPLIADIIAENMDFEGAKMMAKRLRAAVPAEILEATNEEDGMDDEAKVSSLTAQNQQLNQQLQAINAHAETVEQELKIEKEENKLLKMKQDIELKKAEMDQMVKMKGIQQNEEKTELDFLIKEQELILQRRQLELEEKKLQLLAIQSQTDMDSKMLDRSNEKEDRDAARKALSDADDFDAIDSAQPSDLKAPASGL